MQSNKSVQKAKLAVLVGEYNRRKERNEKYSQRAFARDMGISHTLISLIFSGKKDISASLVYRFLERAKLAKEEQDVLKLGVPQQQVEATYEKISLEKFELISDWIYYAILSLIEIEGVQHTPEWIAERLGIPLVKAKRIVEKLLRLGIIESQSDGSLRAKSSIVIENDRSTEATRSFNRGLLKKAIQCMEERPFEERDLSSTTFTLDPKFMSYAVERIRNFRRSLSHELENLGEKREVYALTVQIFPLSVPNKENIL